MDSWGRVPSIDRAPPAGCSLGTESQAVHLDCCLMASDNTSSVNRANSSSPHSLIMHEMEKRYFVFNLLPDEFFGSSSVLQLGNSEKTFSTHDGTDICPAPIRGLCPTPGQLDVFWNGRCFHVLPAALLSLNSLVLGCLDRGST